MRKGNDMNDTDATMDDSSLSLEDFLHGLGLWPRLEASAEPSGGRPWAERLPEIAGFCEKQMDRYYMRLCPQLTDHGQRHLRSVAKTVDRLATFAGSELLSDAEVFVLLASCWAHDLGIIRERRSGPADGGDTLEAFRDRHWEETEEYVKENASDMQLRDDEACIVGRVGRGHGEQLSGLPCEGHDEKFDDVQLANQIVRQRCLSALLQIADALDLDASRADLNVLRLLSSAMASTSKQHYLKHAFVDCVSLDEGAESWVVKIGIEFRMPTKPDKLPFDDLSDQNMRDWHLWHMAETVCRWIIFQSVANVVEECTGILGEQLRISVSLKPWEQMRKAQSDEIDVMMLDTDLRSDYIGALAVEGLRRNTDRDGSIYEQHRTLFNLLLESNDMQLVQAVRPAEIAPNLWSTAEWRKMGGSGEHKMTPLRYYQFKQRWFGSEIWSVTLWSLCEAYYESILDLYGEHKDDEEPSRFAKLRIHVFAHAVLKALTGTTPPAKFVLLPTPGDVDFHALGFQISSNRQVIVGRYDGPVRQKRVSSEYEVNRQKAVRARDAFEAMLARWYPRVDLGELSAEVAVAAFACTWECFRDGFRQHVLRSDRMSRTDREGVEQKLKMADQHVQAVLRDRYGRTAKELARHVLGTDII